MQRPLYLPLTWRDSPPEEPPPVYLANLLPGFWDIYRNMPSGSKRRALLLGKIHKAGKLPVNQKYQASTKDVDLAKLLKQGKVRQGRGPGGRGFFHGGLTRQTYLVPV